MKINYNKGGIEPREAYFKWRKEERWLKHNVRSFIAGYNAAKVSTFNPDFDERQAKPVHTELKNETDCNCPCCQ